MEKDINDVKREKTISMKDARKLGKSVPSMNGNYLGYIDNNGNFDFLTYNENYIEVQETITMG